MVTRHGPPSSFRRDQNTDPGQGPPRRWGPLPFQHPLQDAPWVTQRRPPVRFDSRGRRRATVLLAGTLLSGSGSARLGLFQKGGIAIPSHPSAHACWNRESLRVFEVLVQAQAVPGLGRMLPASGCGPRAVLGAGLRRPAPAGRRHRGKRPPRCGGGAGRRTGRARARRSTPPPRRSARTAP